MASHGAVIFFGLSSVNMRTPGWGTQSHADAVKLLLMMSVTSAFAAIAFCTLNVISEVYCYS